MATRRFLAATLAVAMAVGMTPAFAQSEGTIGGKATDEAKKPYTDYTVQLRDASTGQIAFTVPLNAQGLFTFGNVEMSKKLLVELYNTKQNKVVCTEGPFILTDRLNAKTNVNIDCGKAPAALWLLAAGAGTAAAIALATNSASQ